MKELGVESKWLTGEDESTDTTPDIESMGFLAKK